MFTLDTQPAFAAHRCFEDMMSGLAFALAPRPTLPTRAQQDPHSAFEQPPPTLVEQQPTTKTTSNALGASSAAAPLGAWVLEPEPEPMALDANVTWRVPVKKPPPPPPEEPTEQEPPNPYATLACVPVHHRKHGHSLSCGASFVWTLPLCALPFLAPGAGTVDHEG